MLWTIFKQSFHSWREDEVSQLAAGIAFFAIFSLAPLLLITINLASFLTRSRNIQTETINQVSSTIGPEAGQVVNSMLNSVSSNSSSIWYTIISIILLILGATGVLASLKRAFEIIWKTEIKPSYQNFSNTIKQRLISFGLILILGLLLTASLVTSAVISLTVQELNSITGNTEILITFANFIISLGLITLLFGALFKVLFDVNLSLKSTLKGALITTILFLIAKIALGWYLNRESVTTRYGIASSIIILLLWIYYTAQIILFGAEFIKTDVKYKNIKVKTKHYAQFKNKKTHLNLETSLTFIKKLSVVASTLLFEFKILKRLQKLKRFWNKLK